MECCRVEGIAAAAVDENTATDEAENAIADVTEMRCD